MIIFISLAIRSAIINEDANREKCECESDLNKTYRFYKLKVYVAFVTMLGY